MSDRSKADQTGQAVAMEPVCNDFDHAWSRGDRPEIAGVLGRVPDVLRTDLLRELILIDCDWRRKAGEKPMPGDYAALFPELSEELNRLVRSAPASSRGRDEKSCDREGAVGSPGHPPLPHGRGSNDSLATEQHLLFAVLAYECELLDLSQLTATCRAWAADKSKPLADLLVQRGWITAADREFLDKQVARKLAKHQHDARVALTVITRGDVCDALKELDDSDINRSFSSWPSSGPVLVETIGYQQPEPDQTQSRYT